MASASIRAAFAREIPGTTKIIIAQRISSVQDADRIIVMEGGRIAQIGNHDEVGRFSASNIVDGDVLLSIKGGPQATVTARDHVLSFRREGTANPRAVMEFASIRLARDLFDGRVNAMACIGRKEITVGGVISMLDNVNRILDRVALYLA